MINAIFLAQVETPAASLWMESLKRLTTVLTPVTGSWIGANIGFGITWLQLIVSALVAVATVVIVGILRRLMRRKVRREQKKQTAISTESAPAPDARKHHRWHLGLKMIFEAGIRPLTLFIYGWGFYAALRLLFAHTQINHDAPGVLIALKWCGKTASYIALFWFLFRMIAVIEAELKRWSSRTHTKWDDILVAMSIRAMRLIVPLIAVLLIIPTLHLPAVYHGFFQTVASLFLIGFIGFILCEIAATAERAVQTEYRVDVKDNLAARKIQTQVRVLKKIAVALIILITVACMLMVFDSVRQLGKSLLASAGVAGIIIGFAAQKSLGTLLAGIQIAFTQPIRLDDVVIVEGEWGRIEEITLTYVVVAIWDWRRMVLPITYFVEKPFQNWSRTRADLLGSVFLYMDYTVPLGELRAELDRILDKSKNWDRKIKVLQVTDAKEHTIELRILASAADSGISWDLRCEIREGLIGFLQKNYPESLPRTRVELPAPVLGKSSGGKSANSENKNPNTAA